MMFCFQCQETCRNSGCTVVGMCGKKPETSRIMDEIICRLKELAVARKPDKKSGPLVCESLFLTLTNTNFDDVRLKKQLNEISKLYPANSRLAAGVRRDADDECNSLSELLICGLKGIAAYTHHACKLGFEDPEIYDFIFRALQAAAVETSAEKLLAVCIECGNCALRAMALLDTANTDTFGVPVPTLVKTGTGNNPAILVSGHDLADLYDLLKATEGTGIDIYTHGEMLPAHAYPELAKFPHLAGNYGSSWHHQHIDFANFNGPVVITTNCLASIEESYRNRIFATGTAGDDDIPHIPDPPPGKRKDFSKVIELARHLPPPDATDEDFLVCGYGHDTLSSLAPRIIKEIEAGNIKRFIIMAGCDGRHKSREYYTELAENLPSDTIILTAGCAKYRYNKLKTGEINGIPRIIDAGQCNDCYSLAMFALELKAAMKLDCVNKLPLSLDIAWFEQKAVAILLALLAAGFRNIRLGPTLPAFLSPGVVGILQEKFQLKLITNFKDDMANMLAGA